MKTMRSFLCVTLLVLCGVATVQAQDTWFKKSLNDKFTVSFPKDELTMDDTQAQGGMSIKIMGLKEDSHMYMAQFMEFTTPIPGLPTSAAELDTFYTEFLQSFAAQFGGTVDGKTNISKGGVQGVESMFKGTAAQVKAQVFYTTNKVYCVVYMGGNGDFVEEDADKYLATAQFTSSVSQFE